MSQILQEAILEKHNLITEDINGVPTYFLVGKGQSILPNRNRRRYGLPVWQYMENDADFQDRLKRKVILGAIGHPKDGHFEEEKAATALVEQKIVGDDIIIKRQILPTPSGKVLLSMYQAGVQFCVSSRGTGDSTSGENGITEVSPGFYMEGYDDVLDPSVIGTNQSITTESRQKFKTLYESAKIKGDLNDKDIALFETYIRDVFNESANKIKVGDTVHQNNMKFGYGKVLFIKGDTATVKFEHNTVDINVDDLTLVPKNKQEEINNKNNLLKMELTEQLQSERTKSAALQESVNTLTTTNSKLTEELSASKNNLSSMSEKFTTLKGIASAFEESAKKHKSHADSLQKRLDESNAKLDAAKKLIKASEDLRKEESVNHSTTSKKLDAARNILAEKLKKDDEATIKSLTQYKESVVNQFPFNARPSVTKALETADTVDKVNTLFESIKTLGGHANVTLPVIGTIVESEEQKKARLEEEIKRNQSNLNLEEKYKGMNSISAAIARNQAEA